MPAAAFASIQLVRFQQLQVAGSVDVGDQPGILFCEVGADCRAAGTDPAGREAFAFLIIGLHDTEASARELIAAQATIAPWTAGAVERWSGVLAPFRLKGIGNQIDRTEPAPPFDRLVAAPPAGTPVVSLTSIGWDLDGLDLARVQDVGTGVAAVRVSMTAVPGLRVQHSFFYPGVIAIDPPTLSFWDDEASMVAWAYRQSTHKRQMDRFRSNHNADRASFTRLTPRWSEGTWHGIDPVAPR